MGPMPIMVNRNKALNCQKESEEEIPFNFFLTLFFCYNTGRNRSLRKEHFHD